MLTQPTLEKLIAMRLRGMAEAFREQQESADIQQLSFEERFGLLIDRQWNWRQNRALERRLHNGRLKGSACVEDIDFRTPRGLDRQLVRSLTDESVWVREHQHLFLIGPTGIGKSWLACALAQKACRDGFSAQYLRLPRFLRELSLARGDGSYPKLLASLAKTPLLVLDDFGSGKLTDEHRRDLLEILEDRYALHSTLVTSQFPVERWHDLIGDPTLADAILDRLVHNAYKLTLEGDSMRKKRPPIDAN